MSLANMTARLRFQGGAKQHDRMIESKLRSMLVATKYSYQAGEFQLWSSDNTPKFVGLFNPVTNTENFDTKMISTEFCNNVKVGSYFEWKDTKTYWIVFLRDLTELAYFRGECRMCNFKVQWVNEDQRLYETLISVIGPSATQLRTSSSMQAKVAEDFPNANLKLLVQDNPLNRKYFTRYQTFLIQGTAYQIEEVDRLSMPGVIQLQATEYYANRIDDDIEKNIRNAWNVQPIIPEYPTDYAIEGPLTVKPQIDAEFTTMMRGGEWFIVENYDLSPNQQKNPATILTADISSPTIIVHWNSMKSGMYTIGYRMPSGQIYQKSVLVESLF